MGIGALILFIAMILVAGIAANVMIQTMNSLEEQALATGTETIREVSGGLIVTQANGYTDSTDVTQLAIFIEPMSGTDEIDLMYTYISLTDTNVEVILNFTTVAFNESAENGLFGTIDDTKLTASNYGIIVIRDVDSSISSTDPSMNEKDLVVLLVNTTACFSGIDTRTEVRGEVVPEYGAKGIVSFVTPPSYINTIELLQ
jgi:flagellin FlaB